MNENQTNSGPTSDPGPPWNCACCGVKTLGRVGDIPTCLECYSIGRFHSLNKKPTWSTSSVNSICKDLSEWFSEKRVVRNISTMQHRISEWAEKTFPNQSTSAKICHLADEVAEVMENPNDGEELADCAILLFNLAERAGVDLMSEVEKKFAKNRKRIWGKPDERGVVKHII